MKWCAIQLNCWIQTYQVKERIQLGTNGWTRLYAPLCDVSGTVSCFVGGLSLPKTRQMYRFTFVKESFCLNCKFLGTTSAVWFYHFKNKAPVLYSELKCAGTTFCPPASKNIPYVSRNSNTPSEGAILKKTAQVNVLGMCIYKEKNTLCVFGTLCLSGYGFARCEKQLLLFHCCSLDVASHETVKCSSE